MLTYVLFVDENEANNGYIVDMVNLLPFHVMSVSDGYLSLINNIFSCKK
jgi:hypothetical protein